MLFRISGQHQSLGTPVEGFVVDAEDEATARDRATRLGISATSVDRLSDILQPTTTNAPSLTAAKRGMGVVPFFLGVVLGAVTGAAVALLLPSLLRPVPESDMDTKFQTLVDANKARLRRFLHEKGSSLERHAATIDEETVLDKRPIHPYLGRIIFTYVSDRHNDGNRGVRDAVACYNYSKKEKEWKFEGVYYVKGSPTLEPMSGLLVQLADLREVFSKWSRVDEQP